MNTFFCENNIEQFSAYFCDIITFDEMYIILYPFYCKYIFLENKTVLTFCGNFRIVAGRFVMVRSPVDKERKAQKKNHKILR